MSTLYTLKSGSNSIDVNMPPIDEDKWLIVAEEKYRPDKQKFIYESFIEDYPHIKVSDGDQVYALASRSATLSEWLSKKNLEYAIIEGSPTFFRDHVDPKKFDAATKEILRLNAINAKKASEQAAAATRYKNSLAEIEQKYEDQLNTGDKTAKVLSLNTTSLPLSIQLAIENYSPAKSSSPNQKAFARECLINYKIALLKLIKDDPKVDIDRVIIDNQEK